MKIRCLDRHKYKEKEGRKNPSFFVCFLEIGGERKAWTIPLRVESAEVFYGMKFLIRK